MNFGAPFPEELIYRVIKFYSYRGNIVLDMFGGTGTVAVVAYKTGRRSIHIDISEEYCKIAYERLKETQSQMELFATVLREPPVESKLLSMKI